MKCDKCGEEITIYELFPRSYRLYVRLCKHCKTGFLAHHFDTNLEIYRLKDVSMKRSNNLIFLTGLEVEPRVFDFKLKRGLESIIVIDEDVALGELAKADRYIFAPYSEKAVKRLCRHLGCDPEIRIDDLTERVVEEWEASR
ncbi:MAG: hypothetical protein ACE5PM_05300 [Candidatus Hydrothermarchaeales archaeon]